MAAATPHNPLLCRTMVDPMPDDLQAISTNFARIGAAIRDLGVDVIVLVGSDHIRQFYSDKSPAFVVGMADSYHGTWENEARTFGAPYAEMAGCRALAEQITGREVLTETIDFAVSHEWRLDHSYVVPLHYMTPQFDIPVVPINTNCVLPPLPAPRRFAVLGTHLRDAIRRWDSPSRVAVLTSGHMANEIGGPQQFLGGGSANAEFDATAVDWVRTGDLEAAVRGATYETLAGAGNMAYQFVNVLVALAAMDCQVPEMAEATPSRFSPSPFFLWTAA